MANEEKDISRIISEGTLIDKALVLAARNAVKEHIQKGQPLVVWRNGKTVLIPPGELELEGFSKQE
ncbi:MAG: hypothetical protein ABSG67_10345 [Thermoguttaceae bacterium]|jgi:hypothetical protein